MTNPKSVTCIPVITRNVVAKVKVDDVVYVEKRNGIVTLLTDGDEYRYRCDFNDIIIKLDRQFFPCFKYCYINMEKIVQIKDGMITFSNGAKIEPGRDNYVRTKQAYAGYLRGIYITDN